MERELPEIKIEGTTFKFDIDCIVLIDKDNPSNEITFEHMRDEGTHYAFEYSAIHKNYHSRNAQSFPELLRNLQSDTPGVANPPITVEIPRIGKIDPEGMCRKYGCSLQDINQKSDFEIMVNQDIYSRRLNREPVTIDLAGKIYEVDTKNNSLRPQDGTGNDIFLNDFYHDYYNDDAQVYLLFYDIRENKVVDVMRDGSREKTENRIILEVPHLYTLDPIGANREFGYNPEHGLMYGNLKMNHIAKPVPWQLLGVRVASEIPFDLNACDMRVSKGMLPTVDIAGHTFYVDIRMDMLRPKDDFLSKGIVFSDIANYYDLDKRTYTIPYNPKTHEFQEPDYRTIKELPKDLIAVRFPSERLLDRIGWNKQYGFELTHGLDKQGLKLQFEAKQIPWKKTFLVDLIKSNLKTEKNLQKTTEKQQPTRVNKNKPKGRKM
tara:strand:+ start:42866 stop:44167 length:1302 start_codon:yes stop_codon:yes gene_type:complete